MLRAGAPRTGGRLLEIGTLVGENVEDGNFEHHASEPIVVGAHGSTSHPGRPSRQVARGRAPQNKAPETSNDSRGRPSLSELQTPGPKRRPRAMPCEEGTVFGDGHGVGPRARTLTTPPHDFSAPDLCRVISPAFPLRVEVHACDAGAVERRFEVGGPAVGHSLEADALVGALRPGVG